MPYKLLAGAIGLIVFAYGGIRLLLKAGRTENGDYVAQNVLTRINTDYRDTH